MILKELKPRKALNKAFLKVKPNRTEIEGFKTNLITLLDRAGDPKQANRLLAGKWRKKRDEMERSGIHEHKKNNKHYVSNLRH